MAYRDRVGSGSSGPDGIFVVKDGCNKSFYACSWDDPSQIRIYPCPDGQGGFHPARLSTRMCDFSDFIVSEEAVRFYGQHRKLTFISSIKGGSDTDESPPMRLFRIIKQAVRSNKKPEWREYTEGRNSHLVKPSVVALVQGYLPIHNGKNIHPNYAPNIVFMFQKTAREALEQLFYEQNPAYQHPGDSSPVDLTRFFKNPDPTDIQGGYYVKVFQDKGITQPAAAPQMPGAGNSYLGGNYSGPPQTQAMFSRYAIEPGDRVPLDPQVINTYWKAWKDVLRYFDPQEQVRMLASAVPMDLMHYAFDGTGLLSPGAVTSYPAQGTVTGRIQSSVPNGPNVPQTMNFPDTPTAVSVPAPEMPMPQMPMPQMPQPPQMPTQQMPAPQMPQMPQPQQMPPMPAMPAMPQMPQMPAPALPPQGGGPAPQTQVPPPALPAETPVDLDLEPSDTSGQVDPTAVPPQAQDAMATLEQLQTRFGKPENKS